MELYLMRVGTMRATGGPVAAYLVRHEEGDVLIDTGYPRARAGAYAGELKEPVQLDHGQDVVSRLAGLGIDAGEVRDVIISHFDPDHAGNMDAFPRATFWVQEEHYDTARSGAVPRLERFRALWDLPEDRFALVKGDQEFRPGIELVESGGHIPGHQSVLLRPPGARPVLLAIDAIPTSADLDAAERSIYPFDMDEERVRESTRKLADLARRENARIVHGHDPDQWRILPLAPEPFPL
ncbi:N-acyl homoserine lactonase family protein [Thermomonospora cellulosilytica]|uniref:N-acyl homoserine lactone hydrolase n=1 Tax=Thermomonospora cellulosilytica TaxID=1411118 RepID=A0A7W3RAQ3_9ACTN|nr:N-acyl homoserine lactonase family protein [Thermomonospora cellulosilytica]MBA9005535.1 N-acyl homoserine lactone hydrolase [Thermomonospora cellulosilytica]